MGLGQDAILQTQRNVIRAADLRPPSRAQPCTLFRALGCAMIIFGILIVLVTDGLVPHQDVTDLSTLQRDMMNVPFALLTAGVLCLCLASVAAFATRKLHKRRELAQLAIAVAAGSFGALSNVLGKSAIEIVKELICSGNFDLLENPIAYAIVGCMIATLLCQVCCLNTGLSNFETMVITSSTNATLTIVGTMESIVYFEEYRHWEWFTWCLMPREFFFVYRHFVRESCSQCDSLPLIYYNLKVGVGVATCGLLVLAGVLDPCTRSLHKSAAEMWVAPMRLDAEPGSAWARALQWMDYEEPVEEGSDSADGGSGAFTAPLLVASRAGINRGYPSPVGERHGNGGYQSPVGERNGDGGDGGISESPVAAEDEGRAPAATARNAGDGVHGGSVGSTAAQHGGQGGSGGAPADAGLHGAGRVDPNARASALSTGGRPFTDSEPSALLSPKVRTVDFVTLCVKPLL